MTAITPSVRIGAVLFLWLTPVIGLAKGLDADQASALEAAVAQQIHQDSRSFKVTPAQYRKEVQRQGLRLRDQGVSVSQSDLDRLTLASRGSLSRNQPMLQVIEGGLWDVAAHRLADLPSSRYKTSYHASASTYVDAISKQLAAGGRLGPSFIVRASAKLAEDFAVKNSRPGSSGYGLVGSSQAFQARRLIRAVVAHKRLGIARRIRAIKRWIGGRKAPRQ